MANGGQSLELRIRNVRSKDREVTISCGRGLILRVLPHGTKVFSYRYRPQGSNRQRRLTIGTYPDMTLASARGEAERLKSEVRNGRDPVVDRRRAEQRTEAPDTVSELIERFLEGHARLKTKARTAAETERLLANHVRPKIGDLRLGDVRRSDLAALIRGEADRVRKKKGKGIVANRIRAATSKMFGFAIAEGWLEQNPAAGIPLLVTERPRERTLTAEELGQLSNELCQKDRDDGPPRGFATMEVIHLILLTGARSSEIASLRRRHFDSEAGTLTVEDAKTSTSNRTLYLSAAALAVVRTAVAKTDGRKPDAYLFPANPSLGESGSTREPHIHRESITRAGQRLAERLKHTKPVRWSIHDLRRTFITWAHETGHEPDLVRRVAGHVAKDVHGRVYDRSKRAEDIRSLLNEWAGHIAQCALEAARGDETSRVVVLKQR